MTNSNGDGARRPQAVVDGGLGGAGPLNGRAGASEPSIGGPDGRGHGGGGEPLRAAERFARRVHGDNDTAAGEGRKFPLSHVEIAVSYHHGGDGGRDSFERSIRLQGHGEEERAQLMQAANMCPVERTLGLSADIRTNDNVSVARAASYDDDLSELPIPNIDPD